MKISGREDLGQGAPLKTGPNCQHFYDEGASVSLKRFDDLTSSDSVSLDQRDQNIDFGPLFRRLGVEYRVPSLAVSKPGRVALFVPRGTA
jgi:hypothetical protein